MKGYRGYRARGGLARSRPQPGRHLVALAVPAGSRRLATPRPVLLLAAALAEDPVIAGLRADGREHVHAVARALAAEAARLQRAGWLPGVTWRSRDWWCEQAGGISWSTWKKCRRLLEARGFLGLVTNGRKYWNESGETRHDAAVYVLAVPRRILRKIAARRRRAGLWRLSRPPTLSGAVSTTDLPAGPSTGGEGRRGPPSGRAGSRGGPRNGELARGAPGGWGAARALAGVVRQAAGGRITEGQAGHLIRPFARFGWSAVDVRDALECDPVSGRSWPWRLDTMADALGALRWRLSWWLGEGDREAWRRGELRWSAAVPVPSRRQRLAVAASGAASARAAERDARVRGDLAAATPEQVHAHAASIRAAWDSHRPIE